MDAPRGSGGCRGEAPAAAPLLEESSSSCPSPAAKTGEPRRTSSSSFGYDESDEEAAGPAGPGRGAEEPHYISTHEIQLSEVEHDMDFDAALAARWDFEDDNVIYSFVDYASFGSADTPPDGEAEPSCSPASEPGPGPGPVPGRGAPEPDPPCPAGAPRAAGGGHVLLAIGPASRAIKECSDGRGERDSAPGGDMSLRLPAAGREPAKRLLAVPARLQAREPGDYSSGASSAVSELDDADKEVRSLTARAFRSLACPGLDAALPPGSRASSAASRPGSAHRWATYLDLKCGSFGPRAEQSLFHSGGRAQSRALEFVVSRLDGEIAHVETPGPAGPRVLSRLEPLSLSLSLSRRGPPPSPEAPADASSKKSKVASSLLKNVISKKMRLEHESKMERGEITDTSSPRRAAAGLQRQGSRVSEASSEHTLVPAEEPAEPRAPTPRPEPACQVKKSASEAIKATFLRSQHSAFRSWREREAEKLQQQQPPPQPQPHPQPSSGKPRCDWRADLGQVSAGKATKMSRLFVPSMQQAPRGPEPGKQATKCSTARAAAASLMRARAPEIRISLGSIAQGPPPFSIAQLLTPQLARDPPRPAAPDKVPQFQVRDVRDSKAKAPGPLHQVRDVRKLLKSSYSNRDAPDTPSDRGSVASDQGSAEPRARPLLPARAASPGPGKGLGSPPEGTILVHRTSGRLPVATIAPNKSDPRLPAVLKIVSKGAAPWKQPAPPAPQPQALPPPPAERGKGEEEARDEGRPAAGPARNALEKLTAAVRSMEELYSFSRHEWKRKSDPLPITGSHVLSLIASQERGPAPPRPADEPEPEPQPEPTGAVPGKAERSAAPTAPARASHDPRRSSNPDKVSAKAAAFETLARERERQRGPPERPPPVAAPPPPRGLPAPKAASPAKPPAEAAPLRAPKAGPAPPRGPPLPAALPGPDAKGAAEAERAATAAAGPDCGNYLALPRHAGAGAGGEGGRPAPAPGPAALCSLQPFSPGRAAEWRGREEGGGAAGPQPQPPPPSAAELQAAAPAAAYPAALPLAALAGAQPPLLCFSPPSAAEAVPLPLQLPVALAQPPRRVLLDVSTGQLYVVEAPPPPKRRLFDPETGQYVEVPLPLPPPLPAPPLALGPGAAYAPTYMLYPGFLPALSQPGGDAAGSPGAAEALLADSPYYVAAGKPQGAAGARAAEGKPVISITSQPLGPRLIAPPSFDGTTMRFVVEHR